MNLMTQAGDGWTRRATLLAALTALIAGAALGPVSPVHAAESSGAPAPMAAPTPAPAPARAVPAESAAGSIADRAGTVVVAPGVRLPATSPERREVPAATPPAAETPTDGNWTAGIASWFSGIGRRLRPGADDDGAATPQEAQIPSEAAPAATGATPPPGGSATPAGSGAQAPTLANARWLGFTPAVYTGRDDRPGAWIAGPFDRGERTGWIADTATGATARVTLLWRDGASDGAGGGAAVLSHEAAQALGLMPGDVANVAVYLPR